MYPYCYAVSLRIWHPGVDAQVVADTLGLASHPTAPSVQSFWRHQYDVPQDGECAAFIAAAAAALQPHAAFFEQLRSAGGRAEFFIGWFGDKNFGDTFRHTTLALLAELRIDVSVDVYPDAAQNT